MRLTLRMGALALALVASVMAGLSAGGPALAANPGTIVNAGSGLCLQPVPNSTQSIFDDGVRIAQMDCTGRSEQRWQSLRVGTSGGQTLYYLINALSGKCLDVTDANGADRAPIQQYTCNGGGSEKWIARPYSFGAFQYLNSRTGKCLDVPGAATSPVYLWQYRCTTANTAQAFSFPS